MRILLIVFLSFSSIAYAYDEKYMRCGNGIVERGMSISKAAKVCGNLKPAKKTPYTKMFHTNDGTGEVKIYHYEVWEFHQYGKYRMYINFYEGNVNKFWTDTSIRD